LSLFININIFFSGGIDEFELISFVSLNERVDVDVGYALLVGVVGHFGHGRVQPEVGGILVLVSVVPPNGGAQVHDLGVDQVGVLGPVVVLVGAELELQQHQVRILDHVHLVLLVEVVDQDQVLHRVVGNVGLLQVVHPDLASLLLTVHHDRCVDSKKPNRHVLPHFLDEQ